MAHRNRWFSQRTKPPFSSVMFHGYVSCWYTVGHYQRVYLWHISLCLSLSLWNTIKKKNYVCWLYPVESPSLLPQSHSPYVPCMVYLPTKLGHKNGVNVGIHIPAPWVAYGKWLLLCGNSLWKTMVSKEYMTSIDIIIPLTSHLGSLHMGSIAIFEPRHGQVSRHLAGPRRRTSDSGSRWNDAWRRQKRSSFGGKSMGSPWRMVYEIPKMGKCWRFVGQNPWMEITYD